LAIEIDPGVFQSGRHLATWAGLTPKEHSTGGKHRKGGISRAGNKRLRVLPLNGATAVIPAAMKPDSKQMNGWSRAILLCKVVAPAPANKMARVAWAMITTGKAYRRLAGAPAVPAWPKFRHVTLWSRNHA